MRDKTKIVVLSLVITIIFIILFILVVILPMNLNEKAKKEINIISEETSITEKLEEQEKEIFNQKFMVYNTENDETVTYAKILILVSKVANNNDNNENRKIDINGTIVTSENVQEFKELISENLEYKINCILDEDGYVKTIELRYKTVK